MPHHIIYTFRRCPFAIRARLAIAYANVSVEFIEVSLKNKPETMLAASPKATVPVLITDNAQIIDESLDIMHWSLAQSDPDQWYDGLNTSVKLQINNLVKCIDNDFKPILDSYKYADRYPEYTEAEYRKRAEFFLAKLERLLKKQDYLFDNRITLADVAIFPFIRQFAFVNKQWFDESPYINLQKWLIRWLDSPLFQEVMSKKAL